MRKETLNRIGLAATIMLVPGGFILGAALAARHYRNGGFRKAASPSPSDPDED